MCNSQCSFAPCSNFQSDCDQKQAKTLDAIASRTSEGSWNAWGSPIGDVNIRCSVCPCIRLKSEKKKRGQRGKILQPRAPIVIVSWVLSALFLFVTESKARLQLKAAQQRLDVHKSKLVVIRKRQSTGIHLQLIRSAM